MNKCVFLDRDGVLNHERGDYTFRIEDFLIPDGVKKALILLKDAGFKLVVITNQGGISKGLFTRLQMEECHAYLIKETGGMIDDIYYSPYHSQVTNSISKKPGSLLFERAIAKYQIDVSESWMVGDSERDMVPAKKLGIRTIFIGQNSKYHGADAYASDLLEATGIILSENLSSIAGKLD